MSVVEIHTAIEADLPRLQEVLRDSSWSNDGDRVVLTEHPEFLELSPDAVPEGQPFDQCRVGISAEVDNDTPVDYVSADMTGNIDKPTNPGTPPLSVTPTPTGRAARNRRSG